MNSFLQLVNHPFKFQLYLLYRLPAAFFSGIKVKECTAEKCVTSIPYKWLTQNPFRSTYFASLSMAGEMSTGLLALNNVYKRKPEISMLVTKMEAHYFKKATGITFFTCEEGARITNAVNEAINDAEGRSVTITSTGRNKNDELIAEFLFTWSFKKKEK